MYNPQKSPLRVLLTDALELYLSVDRDRLEDVKAYIADTAPSKWLRHKQIEKAD